MWVACDVSYWVCVPRLPPVHTVGTVDDPVTVEDGVYVHPSRMTIRDFFLLVLFFVKDGSPSNVDSSVASSGRICYQCIVDPVRMFLRCPTGSFRKKSCPFDWCPRGDRVSRKVHDCLYPVPHRPGYLSFDPTTTRGPPSLVWPRTVRWP